MPASTPRAPRTPLSQATPATPGTVTVAARSATAGAGFVVVTSTSTGGSTPTVASLAVVPVRARSLHPRPRAPTSPLVGGKIEVLDATSGTLVRTLAPGATGVGQVSVTDDGQWVYYATPTGVLRTKVDGSGAPASVTADPATQVAVAGKDNEQLAWSYVSPTGAGQDITWRTGAGKTGTIHISDSLPPEAETLAISPDGTQVVSYVRTGTAGLRRPVPAGRRRPPACRTRHGPRLRWPGRLRRGDVRPERRPGLRHVGRITA